MRKAIGLGGLAAAAVVLIAGFASTPSAGACQTVNGIARSLGQAATCSTTPNGWWFAVAGVAAVAGLVVLMGGGKKEGH